MRSKWLLAGCLVCVITIAESTLLIAHSAAVQGITTASQPSWQSINNAFNRRRDRGPGGAGGSRTGDLCLISPGKPGLLWNTLPLFTWRGRYSTIAIKQVDQDQILWRATASKQPTDLKRLRYTGSPLKAGQSYEWLFFFDQTSSQPMLKASFKIMDERDRASITNALKTQEMQLKTSNEDSESIALHRANYFAQRQLWADVLQEMYSVQNPSDELRQIMQKTQAQICQSEKP